MTQGLTLAELAAMEARFKRMGGTVSGRTTANGPRVSQHISNAELLAMEARKDASERRLALLKHRSQHA